ncbi:ferritin-like domain-containing protein [Hymenobacter jejuensis]|uniref:Ferritin-like domain-containing protein n=1 Tax=Hymenobacter jejuensis TaxID=2502781 RepID=A0A5B8A2D3_9BACT|nr:ferritin-like domain-containing protein [Hymenobacter jejuensis]QDA60843.1 ferritin-like domain-containing protein [Hymenobacter jejuensis]
MNILKLLADLAEVDPEITERLSPRRDVLNRLGKLSGKTAVAALPMAFGTLLQQAYGGPKDTIYDALRLALTLEYLESEFYGRALGVLPSNSPVAAGLIPADARAGIETIYRHEQQHVDTLKLVIQSSGGDLPAKPNFDFTGSKNGSQSAPFGDVFTNFDTFLKVAQTLEDTGVRAYKGQVANLAYDNAIVEAAVRIHSMEARHASHIRTLRRGRGANVKSWISSNDEVITVPGKTDAAYAGEESTKQLVTLASSDGSTRNILVPFDNSGSSLPIDIDKVGTAILVKVAEAFDEPLTAASATAVASAFIF